MFFWCFAPKNFRLDPAKEDDQLDKQQPSWGGGGLLQLAGPKLGLAAAAIGGRVPLKMYAGKAPDEGATE